MRLSDRERAELARGRADDPVIKVVDLAYVMFEKPDLAVSERFLADFGLLPAGRVGTALFLRGYGGDAYCYVAQPGTTARFVGFALRAAAAADLYRVAALPGASAVEAIDAPGGGRRVRLRAPHGFEVHVVHGIAAVAPTPLRPPLQVNFAADKPRANAAQRPPAGPAQVHRLGHVVMQAVHHSRTLSWLLRTFGFIVSDYQLLARAPEAGPVVAFLRCDLGATPADHHSVALGAGFADAFEHAAFEVQDLDAVALGGEHLRRQGWKHAWGIGRHILGSQLFDYWRDPDGQMVEHYADGDRFDAAAPTGRSDFGRDSLAQWGPPLPKDFIDTALSPRKALQLVAALARSEDLTLRKLRAMAGAVAAGR